MKQHGGAGPSQDAAPTAGLEASVGKRRCHGRFTSTNARAAHQFDGGLPRAEAEAQTFKCCVVNG
jgi:hypothetical protein